MNFTFPSLFRAHPGILPTALTFSPSTMILSAAAWASVFAVLVGGMAIWSNPKRTVNRSFFFASLHVALWLLCMHFAFTSGRGLRWFRMAAVVGCAFPAQLWLLKEAIVHPALSFKVRFWSSRAWWIVGALLAALSVSNSFISYTSTPGHLHYEYGYVGYVAGGFAAYLCLSVMTRREMRAEQGVRRLELQVPLLGGGAAAVVAHGFIALGSLLSDPSVARFVPLIVLALFSGTAWAIVSTRVVDTRHILALILEKLTLVATVSLVVWAIQQIGTQVISETVAFVLALAFGLWFASAIHPWLQDVFHPHTRVEHVRRAAFGVARQEMRPEAMEEAFSKVLKRWAKCEEVMILFGTQGRLAGSGLDVSIDSPSMKTLHQLRWVTPERLTREKPVSERVELQLLLAEFDLGAMVANVGSSLAFVVGLGVPLSRRPYTYPEVNQLLELATIIENAMSRAHYLVKAQHAEQLATVGLMGASVAHEIRNPLVSIKTFVQLLPQHYSDPVFRSKFFRLIGDEVNRIDRLTEQLLDLASPRVFSKQDVRLHDVMKSCVDLIAAKADDKGVTLIADFQALPDVINTDANALKQVILNLGFNALQALEGKKEAAWVRFETKNVGSGIEVLVADNGPGLTQEVWQRLFQPFQSTKSSGFGLGLAICRDILSSLQASITADPPGDGAGATFRIHLPSPAMLR